MTVRFTESWEHEEKIAADCIRRLAVAGRRLSILEAGCGQAWRLDLSGVDFHLTGIDLDADALDMRLNQKKDLDAAVVGDLRSADFPPASFDVIYCAFVLEHVQGAERVLLNFTKWLRQGGCIILRIPDPESVHGFLTRMTPHWVHVIFHRHVLREPNAGRPGFAPYPVYYDAVLRTDRLHGFCHNHGLEVVDEYADAHWRPGEGALKWFVHGIKYAVHLASLGKFSHRHTNKLYVIASRPVPTAGAGGLTAAEREKVSLGETAA
ncbi:MAG: class I SAM-dependent methyltransferase [Caenispirillum sp.]|nr:class I SAM-dependent methyltransferase [Caenispirillum sp.]